MIYCESDHWLLKRAAEGAKARFVRNPLDDTNEAMMLLLHVGGRIVHSSDEIQIQLDGIIFKEPNGFDAGAAVRRAIVRAAASRSRLGSSL